MNTVVFVNATIGFSKNLFLVNFEDKKILRIARSRSQCNFEIFLHLPQYKLCIINTRVLILRVNSCP